MRALLCEPFSSYRDLRLADVPVPEPGPGQLRIAVH